MHLMFHHQNVLSNEDLEFSRVSDSVLNQCLRKRRNSFDFFRVAGDSVLLVQMDRTFIKEDDDVGKRQVG
jgi:hypothetical protein